MGSEPTSPKEYNIQSSPPSESSVEVENPELAKNTNWVIPETKFPPAPVKPDIIPNNGREMKGMMPTSGVQKS